MALTSPSAYQQAARAGRGDLRALETFLRATADTIADPAAGTATAGKAAVLGTSKNLDVLALPVSGLKIGTAGAEVAVTTSAAEMNLLKSAGSTNGTASVAAVLDANKVLRTAAHVGTANTGTTAVEVGDGYTHTTILTVATTLGSIAGGAALGLGKLLYTFPAGAVIIESANMSMAITQSQGHITTDTPIVGLGTVIASGAVSVLSGTATFQNIVVGTAAADCNGTATVKTAIPTANVPLVIETAAAHTLHFNAAVGWSASGDAAAAVTGTVVVNWRSLQ